MQSALHITTTIQPGNKIELQIPDGGIGDTVEVFVILADKATTTPLLTLDLPSLLSERLRQRDASRTAIVGGALPLALRNENRQSILATIDTIHSQQPSRTAAEIEQQIQEAHDGWEN
jgi:hypothetical protein